MRDRQARVTQTAQQGSDRPGNEADKNTGGRQAGGAHNEHMYCDVFMPPPFIHLAGSSLRGLEQRGSSLLTLQALLQLHKVWQ